jgi:Mce-associated membrane protein
VTVLVDEAPDTQAAPAVDDRAPDELAGWHIRAAAFAVDVLPGVAVVATMALVWLAVPPQGLWWWVSISVLVFAALATMVNRAVLPAVVGWSLGRALLGISVVRNDGTAVGVGRLLLRELAHLLDTLSVCVGWLWPLRDSRRRTFADLLVGTEVRVAPAERRPADIKRRNAIAVGVAVSLCVAGAAISLFAIFLPDRAADKTRAEVTEQGPKIVAQMLTYDPKSLQQDFDHARSLTTDKYRPELLKQQESVQKGHPAVNEYWVTDSTVLTASRNSATMLLFMQGHRGGGDQERFITATVRVTLVKGGNGQWLVDDLDVVTKPKPAAPPAKSPGAPPAPPAAPAPPKGEK